MSVGVDESRRDRFSLYVENFRANRCAAFCANPGDAIIFDDHIGIFQDFIALHGDDGRTAEHDAALGSLAGKFQADRNFLNVLFLFLEFLRFLLFLLVVLLFVFFCFRGVLLVFILVRVFAVSVFFLAVFLFVLRRLE